MRGWCGVLVGALAVYLGAAQTAASAKAQDARKPPTSVRDGIYTDAQAARGKVLYKDECAICHGEDLKGDEVAPVPALLDKPFLSRWENRPLSDLWDRISVSMPQDSPGHLSQEAYRDIVAYLLQSNGFPAGREEFPSDRDVLKGIALK